MFLFSELKMLNYFLALWNSLGPFSEKFHHKLSWAPGTPREDPWKAGVAAIRSSFPDNQAEAAGDQNEPLSVGSAADAQLIAEGLSGHKQVEGRGAPAVPNSSSLPATQVPAALPKRRAFSPWSP